MVEHHFDPKSDNVEINDKGIVAHHPKILKDDSDVPKMFSWMVSEDGVLYLWVCSNYKCRNSFV